MDVTIRKARPNDAEAVKSLMYSSGSELYDYLYAHAGKTAQDFIAYQFTRGTGFAGYKMHLVAEFQNEIVGVVEVYNKKQSKQAAAPHIMDALRFYPITSWPKVVRRLMHVESVINPPRDKQRYIANFGVHPNARGKGVGTQMLQYLEQDARKDKLTSLSLDVAFNNPNAQRLYESLGYKTVTEKHFKGDKPNSVPSCRLMVKSL